MRQGKDPWSSYGGLSINGESTATIYTVWFMWYWISLLALSFLPHSASRFLSHSLYSFFPHSFWQAFNFTLGGAEWGEGQGCVNRGQHLIFFIFFFLLIQGEWREKEKLNCPLSSLLRTYTYFSLLSHTSRHWFLPSGFLTVVVLSSRATRVTRENDLSFITLQPLKDEDCGKIGRQVNSF